MAAPETAGIPDPAQPWSEASAAEAADEADSLSYEGALRRGARFSQAYRSGADGQMEQAEAKRASLRGAPMNMPAHANAHAETDPAPRRASVTLRLSAAECAQLKRRAAEAGLTVSAYIRSCTFEAEALRAQVKQALKEMRGELRSELRDEWRTEDSEKRPPMPELSPLSFAAADTRRRWWQLRSPAKSVSAQA